MSGHRKKRICTKNSGPPSAKQVFETNLNFTTRCMQDDFSTIQAVKAVGNCREPQTVGCQRIRLQHARWEASKHPRNEPQTKHADPSLSFAAPRKIPTTMDCCCAWVFDRGARKQSPTSCPTGCCTWVLDRGAKKQSAKLPAG